MSAFKITPRASIEAMITILSAGLIPNLLGGPAIGKSACVHKVASTFNLKLIDVRASGLLPEDINGMGAVVDGHAKFLPFKDKFPLDTMEVPAGFNGWLLFLDELTNASREVQAALYQLLLDRQVGDHKLHPQVFIVAAGNRVSDRAAANAMGTALQSRVVSLEIEPNLDEWLEDVAFPANYDPRLTSFLLSSRGQFYTFNPQSREELTFSAPRTLSMLNDLLVNQDYPLNVNDAGSLPIIAGTVGSDTAAKFHIHCTTTLNLPKMADIIARPDTTPLPDSSALIYGVVTSAISYINENTPAIEVERITQYLMRMPSPSYLVVYGRLVNQRHPNIKMLPIWNDMQMLLSQALRGTV